MEYEIFGFYFSLKLPPSYTHWSLREENNLTDSVRESVAYTEGKGRTPSRIPVPIGRQDVSTTTGDSEKCKEVEIVVDLRPHLTESDRDGRRERQNFPK